MLTRGGDARRPDSHLRQQFGLESGLSWPQNAPLEETPPLRRSLLPLLLCILASADPAIAQITAPGGVALSPFPVLQQPLGWQVVADGSGGVWSFFLGAEPGAGLYAQHVTWDGGYASGFDAEARLIASRGTQVNNMSAASDGEGGAFVLWFGSTPDDSTSPFIALRCLHIGADGQIPTGVPDTGIVVSKIATAGMIAGDGRGGAYVVWEELKSASNPDIVGQHYDRSCLPLWVPLGSPTGRNVCAAVGLQRLRALRADGMGNAYAVWTDSRTPSTVPLYTAQILPEDVAGAPWPANGLRITPVGSGVRIVGSAAASSGGLWIAWRDLGVATQLMGQHVSPAAAFMWGNPGSLMATVTPARVDFMRTLSGDALVTWGGGDIRCSRINAAGARVWASEPEGRVMFTPPTSLLTVRPAADGAGGQWLAWSYDNAGQSDVNALCVDGAGAPRPDQPPEGSVVAATVAPEEMAGCFVEGFAEPMFAWLELGQLRVRRLTGSNVGVRPPAPGSGRVALAPPAPNPHRGDELALRLHAPAGEARLELFDTAGRRVLSREFSATGAMQALRLPGLSPLAPGVYTLRLSAGRAATSRRIVRVR